MSRFSVIPPHIRLPGVNITSTYKFRTVNGSSRKYWKAVQRLGGYTDTTCHITCAPNVGNVLTTLNTHVRWMFHYDRLCLDK
ncbi:hypothetical protein J6590_003933 [Homalodisca vitripennis]|nr:hypothetical protein J6590_003933 [Homalodisca vitripennis]